MYAITKLAEFILQDLLLLEMKRLPFALAKLEFQKFVIADILILLFVNKLGNLVFGHDFLSSSNLGEFCVFSVNLFQLILVL